MTGFTNRAELAVMIILRSMARITVLWRAFVNIVNMAGTTGNIRV